MLLHPSTGNLVIVETDHNTSPALIQGGLRQRYIEAQQDPNTETEEEGDKVKHEKMESAENGEPATKEARLRRLEELQREQAQREEYNRTFGADKPGTLFFV